MYQLLSLFFLLLVTAQAKVQFLGVAIAGGDFGCQIDGSCPTGSTQLPLSNLGGGDGAAQMKHFVADDKINMFRLPISWQFLTANKPSSPLDAGNLAKYDQLVQACLSTGAYCMIDIHNFARYNGAIIGQGAGPSDADFVSLWTQLATKYASSSRIVFELMNEPHDLDIALWAATCQKVVTAIRNAGAAGHMILLPGTNFDSAATLVSGGSAEAMLAITNPDGSTDGLLLDIHKYLDTDNSGTHAECVTDNIPALQEVAGFLRERGRKGIVSETGASSVASCMTAFCSQNRAINQNSDVFVGLVAWGAGSFGGDYLLSLTPTKQGGGLVDNKVMKECVLGTWVEGGEVGTGTSSSGTVGTTTTGKGSTSVVTTKLPTSSGSGSAGSVTTASVVGTGGGTTSTTAGGPDITSGVGGFADNSTSVAGRTTSAGSSVPSPSQPVKGGVGSALSVPVGAMFLCLVALAL